MLDLKLRKEFLGDNMPGTTIAFHNGNAQGATEKTPEEFLKITYPTSDLIKALRSLRTDRNGGPVVLIGGRGKGKSHLMAVLHHAVKTPNVTQQWLSDWSETLQDSSLENFPLCQGYLPITETVSDNEYLNLWDLLFERHPKGDYYKGQFEASRQHIPSRTLIENMLAEQPICMILDEFQTWYDALPIENQGFRVKDSAFSFVQTLSEISRDKPSILMLIVSVRDNTSDAFRQLHRQDPLLIDFNGETARKDRRNLILYRLFENRLNIPKEKIEAITSSYAAERFRLIYQPAGTTNPQKISDEVTDNWPFAPELITLLEDQILMTPAAQETRDMIRILAKSFRAHNANIPIITSAHFPVDGDASQVQSLVDSIAQDAGQERLRDIARRNFSAIKESGVAISYSAEMVSTIWMYSMAPGNTRGVKTPLLQLSLSAGSKIDDNVFNQSLMHLVENSINIHSDSSNSKFWFEQTKNPNTEVRVTAKNDNLWSVNANPGNPATHPEKDILWLRKTIQNCFTSQRREAPSQIIVLGPQWDTNPWEEVAEQERPSKWTRPVLLVIPAAFRDNQSRNSTLGKWLATQVPSRRNTVRFLIQDGEKNIFIDKELLFLSRCSYLCSNAAWGADLTYSSLHQNYDNPLKQEIKRRFGHFLILSKWNFERPEQCEFEASQIQQPDTDISDKIERRIRSDFFDLQEFQNRILKAASEGEQIGDCLDDFAEPALGDVLPCLGDIITLGNIQDMAANGQIALHRDGSWHTKKAGCNFDTALRCIREKTTCTGNDLRKILLGTPEAATGGGVVTTPSAYPSSPNNATPQTPITVPPVSVPSAKEPAISPTPPTPPPPPPPKPHTVPHYAYKAKATTLVGKFEDWGLQPATNLKTVTITIENITAENLKKIITKLHSTNEALLDITPEENP